MHKNTLGMPYISAHVSGKKKKKGMVYPSYWLRFLCPFVCILPKQKKITVYI